MVTSVRIGALLLARGAGPHTTPMSLNYLQAVKKIVCIGRNYAAHIKELNNATPKLPFFFLKPLTLLLAPNRGPIRLPKGVVTHYEVELGVVLNKTLVDLPDLFSHEEAMEAVGGYNVSIDLTARNVQDDAKKKGLPWTIGKGFDTYCPVLGFIPVSALKGVLPYELLIWFKQNGAVKQDDSIGLMLTPIHEILKVMSRVMTLEAGDLVLTGTPKGVGQLHPGDVVEAGLVLPSGDAVEGLYVKFDCVERQGPYVYKES